MFHVNQVTQKLFIDNLVLGASKMTAARTLKLLRKYGYKRIIVNGLQLRDPDVQTFPPVDQIPVEHYQEFSDLQKKQTELRDRAKAIWQCLIPVMTLPNLDNDASMPPEIRPVMGNKCTDSFTERLALAPDATQRAWLETYLPEYEYFMGMNAIAV